MKHFVFSILAAFGLLISAHALDHSHALLSSVLGRSVKTSGVDYPSLKSDLAPLNSYLDSLAAVPESEFKRFSKDQQMALLINLYNATTLKLVADHFPLKSIKEIAARSGGPWKQPVVRLFGKVLSLDDLENTILRPNYQDPRIHFAINCASIGCPALRKQAFEAARLPSQLNEQTRAFLNNPATTRVDAKTKTLYVSALFDWFKSDFVTHSGSVERFIAPFVSAEIRALIEKGGLTLRFTEYDWSLNQS